MEPAGITAALKHKHRQFRHPVAAMTAITRPDIRSSAVLRAPASLVKPPFDRHHGVVATSGDQAVDVDHSESISAVDVRAHDFDAFYAKHRNQIGAALAFTLGSKSLGEEAVDEAMARAFQKWKTVSQYENLAGWIYRVGLNWGRSRQRSVFRRKRREDLVSRSMPTVSELTDVSTGLLESLQALPVDQRAVVVLRYYFDWSVEETAAALDITSGTVKSRSSRGLERLRTVLNAGQEGGNV